MNRTKILLTIATTVLLIAFQNCSPNGFEVLSNISEDNYASVPVLTDNPNFEKLNGLAQAASQVHVLPYSITKSDFDAVRIKHWNSMCSDDQVNFWNVCFEGFAIPGVSQYPHLDWDNPIDDDWDELLGNSNTWKLSLKDKSASNWMIVDRADFDNKGKTGHFWRQDEFLTAENGFEAELELYILKQSESNGVKFHFYDDRHQFKIVFAPDSISFHQLIGNSSQALRTVASDNTVSFKIKISKEPVTGNVSVWKDSVRIFTDMPSGNFEELQTSKGKLGKVAPRIGFGDNNNYYLNHQGAYAIKYLRYRNIRQQVRSPPELPIVDDCSAVWINVVSATALSNRTQRFNLPNPSYADLGKTFEFKLYGVDSKPFSFDFTDHIGGVILTFYIDRIELKANTKPGLPAKFYTSKLFNLNQANKFRLVRSDSGLYWYLYINDQPVPIIYDVKGSGVSLRARGTTEYQPAQNLFSGSFYTPNIFDFSKVSIVSARIYSDSKAVISDIKYIDKAIGVGRCL